MYKNIYTTSLYHNRKGNKFFNEKYIYISIEKELANPRNNLKNNSTCQYTVIYSTKLF